MPMSDSVAVETIDVVVRAIGKVGGIELMLAFGASEALFVIRSRFGNLLFSIENGACTSRTGVDVTLFARNSSYVSRIQIGLGFVSKHMRIAEFTVDVTIRAFGAELIIQSSFAVAASETFTMVVATLGRHFLRLENLSSTSRTSFLLIFCRNLTGVGDDLRSLGGSYSFVANLAINVGIGSNT